MGKKYLKPKYHQFCFFNKEYLWQKLTLNLTAVYIFLFLAIFRTFYLNYFCHKNVLCYSMNKDSSCSIYIIVIE